MLHWFSRDKRWKLTFEGTVPLKKLLSYVYKVSLVVDTDHHFLKLIDVTKCDEILSLVLHLCSRLQTKFKIKLTLPNAGLEMEFLCPSEE